MRLRDLDPHFMRYEERTATWTRVLGDPATWKVGDPTEEVTGPRQYIVRVAALADAQGVTFQCPACAVGKPPAEGGGFVGAHYIDVTFADRGVLPHHGCHGSSGEPTRWQVSGSGLDDLTTAPSILLLGGCGWHGFIRGGAIE